ncbi:alpha/beta hydrolase [Actinoallomurus bryophytorum]|uniref:Pimeloyl-ACP methyl ester carboxylesterase n=1 Tax=Actinoallomurus bryophytorum TaxID=1490222 RepID=A0A543CV43_9ACTN|nr:alpha/beta hydrolase [Actinoallomurus bryophytorum]TQM00976.1 pimeloyl-ACP methyl ester carboxylesterase [Actinoallomurus bryophytorum]
MTERVADAGREISLAYEEIGDAGADPLVLVAGLGQQLHSWPTEFCERLAERGYRVVRFDNRDVGRSTHMRFRPPGPAAMITRRWHPQQYDLTDLATDTVGLLDALGYQDAHLVGISMGGMIAQTVAARSPRRVRTLTSIMSMTGARGVGRPAPSTWLRMAGRRPATRQAAIEGAVRMFRHIGSRGYPFDEEWIRELAGLGWDRDPSREGTGRQLAAIIRSGDRTAQLRAVTAPTLVIHGDHDRMVHPTGGAATARAIAGARLETVPGMGHDLPMGAWPVLLDLIDGHARRAGTARSTDASTTS